MAIAALIVLNVAVAGRLFVTEYTIHWGSIEAAYVSLSTQILAQWPEFSWFPLWYEGIPFQNAYPPLLHFLVAGYAAVTGVSAALAHHAVSGAMYCGTALALFALVRALGGSVAQGFAAGLIASCVSFSAFLIPMVRHDMRTVFGPRRLHALVQYGEGPHITAMALLPLAIVALHFALRPAKTPWRWTAPVALAAVVLSNWLGAFALAAAVVCYLAAFADSAKTFARAAAFGVAAYALAMPWIPPSTLAAIRHNAQWIGGDYKFGAANAIGLLALLAAALIPPRWLPTKLARFSASFAILMAGITLTSEYAKFAILPQPDRYHLEMDLALALLVGALLPARRWAVPAVALLCLWPAIGAVRSGKHWIVPDDVLARPEFKVAQWLRNNRPDTRALLPGSISFWANSFTDTPQMNGGFDQGIANTMLPHAHFQVLSGMGAGTREGEVGKAWLEAFGVGTVVVSGPESEEVFKPFAKPRKFEGVLPEIARIDGNVVYDVPRAYLARAVGWVREDAPQDRANPGPLLDPTARPLRADWHGRNALWIRGERNAAELWSVAITYHPGWSSPQAKVRPDGLGLIVLEPRCTGECAVLLEFDGGLEATVARIACGLAFVALFWLALR
jgi:hypothetical protein